MIRPTFKLPLWAALAVAGAAYVVRSLVLRDGDFTPDIPGDIIAIVAFLIVIGMVALSRSRRD